MAQPDPIDDVRQTLARAARERHPGAARRLIGSRDVNVVVGGSGPRKRSQANLTFQSSASSSPLVRDH